VVVVVVMMMMDTLALFTSTSTKGIETSMTKDPFHGRDPVTNLPIASRWHRHSRIFAGKELSFKQEVAKGCGRKYVSTDSCWE